MILPDVLNMRSYRDKIEDQLNGRAGSKIELRIARTVKDQCSVINTGQAFSKQDVIPSLGRIDL